MIIKQIYYFFISILFLTNCTTYQFVTIENVDDSFNKVRKKAYVINPELKQEYSILKLSQLYTLSNDSLTNIKIKLNPIEVYPMCGNPLIGTIFTFGLIPSSVEDQYIYSFIEQDGNKKSEHKTTMVIRMRLSAYEVFYTGNLEQQIAKGLKLSLSQNYK